MATVPLVKQSPRRSQVSRVMPSSILPYTEKDMLMLFASQKIRFHIYKTWLMQLDKRGND